MAEYIMNVDDMSRWTGSKHNTENEYVSEILLNIKCDHETSAYYWDFNFRVHKMLIIYI